MALSLDLHSPQKWIAFRRLAALNCASRLIRRMHLGPSLALLLSYPRTQKSEPLCAIPKHPDGRGPDDFVVFEVEETLFRVHMSLLLLKIWNPVDSVDSTEPGNLTSDPVILSDTAENFRFFLWDLQAFPHELSQLNTGDSDVIDVVNRLLDITEMANKHHLSVLQAPALESLHHFVLSPHFHSVSSAQHCRVLRIALASSTLGQTALLDDVSRRLIHHILRRRSSALDDDNPLLSFVEDGNDTRLRKIRGAIYYRQLIERRLDDDQTTAGSMDEERHVRFDLRRAHASLSALSSRLCASAPHIPCSTSHPACLRAWEEIWVSAIGASQTSPTLLDLADVLGRLRRMVPVLKRLLPKAPGMGIECGLAALEAVGVLRDEVVEGLVDHFVSPPP
ncbi:hypothetical protein DFH08DRAFT_1073423 [Mycena albidolilacea]|uniref:Uncharacterized protein n=1 Tax=Mycena albidolilacea TaxID=1033008 RepID=A0AAD7AQ35_9AGAR|nr:hypothetical protein DFH08DRAFT_1073423 [Mycena albidolilacea]